MATTIKRQRQKNQETEPKLVIMHHLNHNGRWLPTSDDPGWALMAKEWFGKPPTPEGPALNIAQEPGTIPLVSVYTLVEISFEPQNRLGV